MAFSSVKPVHACCQCASLRAVRVTDSLLSRQVPFKTRTSARSKRCTFMQQRLAVSSDHLWNENECVTHVTRVSFAVVKKLAARRAGDPDGKNEKVTKQKNDRSQSMLIRELLALSNSVELGQYWLD